MKLALLISLCVISGCSTLNDVGIGGEPLLICRARDGNAYLDDKLVGPAQAYGSLIRRFSDGDIICHTVLGGDLRGSPAGASPAVAPTEPAASAPHAHSRGPSA